jgi:osmotically-inducible protein OsmY
VQSILSHSGKCVGLPRSSLHPCARRQPRLHGQQPIGPGAPGFSTHLCIFRPKGTGTNTGIERYSSDGAGGIFVVPDSDVQRAVEAELSCHPNVDDTDIRVNVKNGVVMLSGYARNLFQKYGAEDAVKRVAGVNAVANNLVSRGGVPVSLADSQIARDAADALRRALPLCGRRIRPLVRQGTVTLEGTVSYPFQREVAGAAVRRLTRVAAVVNAISVEQGPGEVASEDIRRRVEEAVRRSPHLAARAINVLVHGSVVTLRGCVRAWSEHREAADCAWSVSGVQHVHNELQVTVAA